MADGNCIMTRDEFSRCKYSGCNSPEGECVGDCMNRTSPRYHRKDPFPCIPFDDGEDLPVVSWLFKFAAVFAVFVVVLIAIYFRP